MRLINTDPLHYDPLMERYIELAKPYELIITTGDFERFPTIALKIYRDKKCYGHYVPVETLQNDKLVRKTILDIQSALDSDLENFFIPTKTKEEFEEMRKKKTT